MPSRPYGSICPLSKACEFLEPRWTIQILAELWAGSTRFNDLRRGLGSISPTLLSRRLKEMEAAGLVERLEDRATGTVDYIRTASAIQLEPILDALSHWAQRNIEAEIAVSAPDLSMMMWGARRYLKVDELPLRRVVMRFNFAKATSGRRAYWLITHPGAAVAVCNSDPGTDIDLYVETTPESMAAIMLGRSSIARETEEGRFFLTGDPRLIRTAERWFPREDGHDIEGVLQMPGFRSSKKDAGAESARSLGNTLTTETQWS